MLSDTRFDLSRRHVRINRFRLERFFRRSRMIDLVDAVLSVVGVAQTVEDATALKASLRFVQRRDGRGVESSHVVRQVRRHALHLLAFVGLGRCPVSGDAAAGPGEHLDEDAAELASDETVDEEVDGRVQCQHQIGDGVDAAEVECGSTSGQRVRLGGDETQHNVRELADDEDGDNDDEHQGDVLAVLGRLTDQVLASVIHRAQGLHE